VAGYSCSANAYSGRKPARSRMQIGDGSKILSHVAERFVDRDLVVVFAAPNAAAEDLADLADDMRVVDGPRVTRDSQLGSLGEHAGTVIGNVTRLRHERGIDFNRPKIARADEIHVCSRLYPFAKKHRLG